MVRTAADSPKILRLLPLNVRRRANPAVVNRMFACGPQDAGSCGCLMRVVCLIVALLWCGPAFADLRVTRDFGGFVEEYKAKYAKARDRGERVIIDGICNSACTLVLGIVPLNRI